jgi:hypothetical protein
MQKYVVGVILLLGCSGSAGSSTGETPDAASEVSTDDGRIGSGLGSDPDIGLTGRDAGETRLDGGVDRTSEEPRESADGAVPDPGELGDAGQDAGAREDAGADAGSAIPGCVPEKCPKWFNQEFNPCCLLLKDRVGGIICGYTPTWKPEVGCLVVM